MTVPIAALDIGGTKIAAGLVEPVTGKVMGFRQKPTEAVLGAEHVARKAAELIAELREMAVRNNMGFQHVAVAICEIVDNTGALRSKSTIDWIGIELSRDLQTGSPVHLVSDVRAAALAEARFGAAKGAAHALYVSIGTGISSTMLIDGRPYAGAQGAALVLATAEIVQHCSVCGTRKTCSLEHLASGAGLAASYGGAFGIDAREILERAEGGEPKARALVENATQLAGQAIAQLSNCIDPEVIVIGGGLGGAKGLYWGLLRPAIEAGLWKGAPAIPEIVQSSLGVDRGVIGAALAACSRIH